MRRAVGIVSLLLAIVLTTGACGGGGGDQSKSPETEASTTEAATTEAASSPRTLPEQGPVPDGEYRTEVFKPTFSFRVGEGWEIPGPEVPDDVALLYAQGEAALSFDNVQKVFDPSKLPQEVLVPAPDSVDGWIDWFQKHPNLETTKPVPATVGGVSGTQLDVVVSSTPKDYPKECGGPCVLIADLSEGPEALALFLDSKDRLVVLDVEGETVFVDIGASEDKFDEFLPKAQQVINTVEWKAES